MVVGGGGEGGEEVWEGMAGVGGGWRVEEWRVWAIEAGGDAGGCWGSLRGRFGSVCMVLVVADGGWEWGMPLGEGGWVPFGGACCMGGQAA